MEDGIVPVSWFILRESVSSVVRLKIDGGSSPFRLLISRFRNTRLDRCPISEGTTPEKLLELKSSVSKFVKLPIEGGIVPA